MSSDPAQAAAEAAPQTEEWVPAPDDTSPTMFDVAVDVDDPPMPAPMMGHSVADPENTPTEGAESSKDPAPDTQTGQPEEGAKEAEASTEAKGAEEGTEAGTEGGTEAAPEASTEAAPEDEPRRMRPDRRTRAELRAQQARADQATRERELAQAKADLWKGKFETLANEADPTIVAEAQKEEAALMEEVNKRTEDVHVPNDADRSYLKNFALEEGFSGEQAEKFVSGLAQDVPALVTVAPHLDNPLQTFEALYQIEQSNPQVAADIVSGDPMSVLRKVTRFENDLKAEMAKRVAAAEAAKSEAPKEAPAPQAAPADKPAETRTTPARKAPKVQTTVDAFGCEWEDDPKVEKTWVSPADR